MADTGKIQDLEARVKALYGQDIPGRHPMADWLYTYHVLPVADYSVELARRFGGDESLARAAAMLHDVADAVMPRLPDVEGHELKTAEIARQLMKQSGYTDDEIKLVVDDAIRFHGCSGNERPASAEGLAMASADAMAHLRSNMYAKMAWRFGNEGAPFEDFEYWLAKKIDRDFLNKIAFDELREELRPDYEAIKKLFLRRH